MPVVSAMSGEPAKANLEAKRLTELRDAATAMKLSYWADQIDIQVEVVPGPAAFAEGKRDEGIAILRRAAEREDASAKNVVTPGPVVPAREMLAAILERNRKPADALAEFEKVLEQHSNRYRAIAGAAQNAKQAGNEQKVVHYAELLLKLAEHADSPRPEIAEARRIHGKQHRF